MESWPGVKFQRGILTRVKIKRGIMTRGHITTWNYDLGSQFNVELWPRVKIPRWIMTPDQNSTLHCESIQRWIMTRDQNSTWNLDLGSLFNVKSRTGVTIQRGSKFYPSEGSLYNDPCLGRSQFNMKNPLNPEHSPLNQDPSGRNSMGLFLYIGWFVSLLYEIFQ